MGNIHPDKSHAPGSLIGCPDCDRVNDNRMRQDRQEALDAIHAAGLTTVKLSDILYREGEWTIDGMPWAEWLDAMTMD